MAGYDGRGARFNVVAVEGNDLSFTVTAVDSDAVAVDLSGATITATVYDGAGTAIDTLTDVVGGAGSNIITLSLTDTEVDALVAPRSWALVVERGGDARTWLAGSFIVSDPDRGRGGTSGTSLTAIVDSDVSVTVSVVAVGASLYDEVVALPNDAEAPASDDLIPFVDVDAARTESVTVANLAASAAFAGTYAPVLGDSMLASQGWSGAFNPPPAEDVPTISVTTGTTTTISGGVLHREKRVDDDTANTLDADGDPYFRYKAYPPDGAGRVTADPTNFVDLPLMPGGAAQSARWSWCIEFETDALEVELRQRAGIDDPPAAFVIDGRWLSETNTARTAAAGAVFRTKLTFPSSKWRRVEVWSQGFVGWGGLWASTGATVRRPTYTLKRTVAFVGDSITAGSGSAPTGATATETYARRVAQLMGADQVILAGIGSTKWEESGVNDVAVSHFGGGRLVDVLTMNPDAVVFVGSVNDNGAVGDVQDDVEAALALCSDVQEVYVAGPIQGNAYNAPVKAGTLASGRRFIDVNSAIYSGNKPDYIGGDNIHPTHAGHKFLAERIHAGIVGADDEYERREPAVVIGAAALGPNFGSPTLASVGGGRVGWLCDASSIEAVGGVFTMPERASRVDMYVIWANGSSGSGDVMWRGDYQTIEDADTATLQVGSAVTVTAGAQGVPKWTLLRSSLGLGAGRSYYFQVVRTASTAGDTLANDAGVLAVRFEYSA